jgi:hypothetical protein
VGTAAEKFLTAGKTAKEFSMNVKKAFVVLAGVVCISLAGCISIVSLKEIGTVTITDIPAEYEGGDVNMPSAAGNGTVSNGAVTIVAKSVDDGTNVANLAYNITKAGLPPIGVFFASVRFDNKVATVKFDDGVQTGIITINGIPAKYNSDQEKHIGSATLLVGKDLKKGGGLSLLFGGWTGSEADNYGTVTDGNISLPVWASVDSLPRAYTESTVTKVIISIQVGAKEQGAIMLPILESFLFDSVELTNGNATVNFSQGTKQ